MHSTVSTSISGASERTNSHIDYDYAFVATDTEAEEILTEAKRFNVFAEQWISLENPSHFGASLAGGLRVPTREAVKGVLCRL